jgi:hypothetical protein
MTRGLVAALGALLCMASTARDSAATVCVNATVEHVLAGTAPNAEDAVVFIGRVRSSAAALAPGNTGEPAIEADLTVEALLTSDSLPTSVEILVETRLDPDVQLVVDRSYVVVAAAPAEGPLRAGPCILPREVADREEARRLTELGSGADVRTDFEHLPSIVASAHATPEGAAAQPATPSASRVAESAGSVPATSTASQGRVVAVAVALAFLVGMALAVAVLGRRLLRG